MPVLKTLNVKIPENLQRHILPHRDDNPAPPKIPSSEKGLALTATARATPFDFLTSPNSEIGVS